MFADLHCHPALYSFNRHRNTDVERNLLRFHPWNAADSDHDARVKGGRATKYAQCDLPAMHEVGARLVFASITPIELGFFVGSLEPEHNTSFRREALKLATGVTTVRALRHLARGDKRSALKVATGVLRNDGPARRLLQRAVLGYPKERIEYLLSPRFDYWDEFQREYRYFLERDNRETPYTTPEGYARLGRYELIRDANHLDETLAVDEDRLAIVFSIEGGHVFAIAPGETRVPEHRLFDRIERLKQWPHPILFITLAHHFDNGLCGHAHSLIEAATLVIDQGRRLHAGFEREDDLGMRVVRALYDLDDALEDRGGRRILIDGKHLSPRCRRELYREVIEPVCERAEAGRGRGLPMLFSHIGYSGVATLAQLIDDAGKEDDHYFPDGYNAWGINVCDEDIRIVHRTGGLLGLCLDRRIAGMRPNEPLPANDPGAVIARQVFGIVDVIWDDPSLSESERLRVWDTLCLGTDFDGVIDPIPGYESVARLPALRADLARHLKAQERTRGIAELGVEELVDKLCWRNAYEFARRELPRRKKHDLPAV
jgi:hypothetical protein